MAKSQAFPKDLHWLIDALQYIDVGLTILNHDFNVQLWNSFMQNHSAKLSDDVLGKNIFEVFPELPENWFRRKAQTVFELHNSAFTTWEQRPYLFRFKNYRPVTSIADFMYQNTTLIPLKDANGNVDYICLILYDVTETAVSRIQMQAANRQLKKLNRIDGLTGLLNRKTWESELDQEFLRFQRHGYTYSMIMFDIDHFKSINDNYGHPAGDAVIRQTASLLNASIREIDIAGRYGGEEFAVILVNTDAQNALVVAERIRQKVEESTVFYADAVIHYTVSLGIAQPNNKMDNKTQWIDTADKALYTAKNRGRNNSVIFQSDSR